MKKLAIIVLVVALLVGALPLTTVAAAPTADLTALAAYIPADAPAYVAIDVSDNTFATLQGVFDRVTSYLPPEAVPPVSIELLLDQALADIMPGASFTEGVNPWLGDTLAFGVTSIDNQYDDNAFNDDDTPGLLVIDITDRAAAENFVNTAAAEAIADGDTVVTSENGYTVYREPDDPGNSGILIGDDVAIVAVYTFDEFMAGYDATLDGNAAFVDAFASLPADDYGIGVYLDTAQFAAAEMAMLAAQGDDAPQNALGNLDPLLSLGDNPIALGFGFLQDTALTIDVATVIDLDALAAMDLSLPPNPAIDPAFTGYIPAGAQFVIHSTGLNIAYENALSAANAAAAMEGVTPEEVAQQMQFVDVMLRGALGVDLEDLLSWMDGDFALFLQVDNAAITELFVTAAGGDEPVFDTWPLEIGFVTAASDPDAAGAVVAALSETLPELLESGANIGVLAEVVAVGGGTGLAITMPVDPNLPPLEFLIAANDEIFALGTRGAVEAALDNADGLDTAANYQEASAVFLPDANQAWYVSGEGALVFGELFLGVMAGPAIGEVFTQVVTSLDGETEVITPPTPSAEEIAAQQQARMDEARASLQQIADMFGLFHSLTISSATADDGTINLRATINLAPAQ